MIWWGCSNNVGSSRGRQTPARALGAKEIMRCCTGTLNFLLLFERRPTFIPTQSNSPVCDRRSPNNALSHLNIIMLSKFWNDSWTPIADGFVESRAAVSPLR